MNHQIGVRGRLTAQTTLGPCDSQSVNDLENQQRITSYPYYSTVKFEAVTADAAPGPFSWRLRTSARGIRAFGYAQGDTMEAAGYLPADGVATAAETNIIQKNQTIGGQYVLIRGMALQWHTTAIQGLDANGDAVQRQLDAQFVSALMRNVSVEIGLNGDENTFKLGTIGLLPGAGGLQGGGQLITGMNALDGNADTQFATNGWPTRSNFFHMPEGLVWKTSDQPDSNLNVIFRPQRDIVLYSGGSPENNALATDLAAIASVSRGYNYPAAIAAELKVLLVGEVIGLRTRSA